MIGEPTATWVLVMWIQLYPPVWVPLGAYDSETECIEAADLIKNATVACFEGEVEDTAHERRPRNWKRRLPRAPDADGAPRY